MESYEKRDNKMKRWSEIIEERGTKGNGEKEVKREKEEQGGRERGLLSEAAIISIIDMIIPFPNSSKNNKKKNRNNMK